MKILFLVDTSFSMNQKSSSGLSLLDVAKSAIEYFIKKRSVDQTSRDDKYYLVTCGTSQTEALKVGLKDDTLGDFLQIVKMLQAFDFSDIGTALKRGLDFLNLNRFVNQVENFARGRRPYVLDPAIVIILTDGSSLTNKEGIICELVPNANSSYPGSEFSLDSFRWDQKIYGITIRFPGIADVNHSIKNLHIPIVGICESTGGKNFLAINMKSLFGIIDILLLKFLDSASVSRIAVIMEPIFKSPEEDPITTPPKQHQFITFKSGPKIWLIPEDYLVNGNSMSIFPRAALPVIKYKPIPTPLPPIPKDFPCDVYQLENSSLSDWLLKNTQKSNPVAFECILVDCPDPLLNSPFAFIYADTDQNVVSLHILPYNYPSFFQILNSWSTNTTQRWKIDFERYLSSIPVYYVALIKTALSHFPINIFPEKFISDVDIPIHLQEILQNRVKLAEKEVVRLQSSILQKRNENSKLIRNVSNILSNDLTLTPRSDILVLLKNLSIYLTEKLESNYYFKTPIVSPSDTDGNHSLPIIEMGDYFSYLKKKTGELRPVDDQQDYLERRTSFGNPFARRNSTGFVDEADILMAQSVSVKKRTPQTTSSQQILSKRKKLAPITPNNKNGIEALNSINPKKQLQNIAPNVHYYHNNEKKSSTPKTATALSPLDQLNINKINNTLKLKAFSCIRTPYKVNLNTLHGLYLQIQGSTRHKLEFLKFIHSLLKLYKRDSKTLIEKLEHLKVHN